MCIRMVIRRMLGKRVYRKDDACFRIRTAIRQEHSETKNDSKFLHQDATDCRTLLGIS
jgi:hypothetical protein